VAGNSSTFKLRRRVRATGRPIWEIIGCWISCASGAHHQAAGNRRRHRSPISRSGADPAWRGCTRGRLVCPRPLTNSSGDGHPSAVDQDKSVPQGQLNFRHFQILFGQIWLNLAQDDSPTSVNLCGVFFSKNPQNRHPERSASQILSCDTPLGREVEGPRGALILLMPLAPFQPPKPAPGGPATVRRVCTDLGMEGDPVHEKMYPATIKCVSQEGFSSRAWVVEKLRTALTR
jgi:hypothetical protein